MNVETSSAETQTKFKEADQLFRAKNFPEALGVLDELDQEYPNVKNILYPRAMCLAHVGRHEEALEVCRQLKVEFGDTRADSLMTQISLFRKAAMQKERDKKDHKVAGSAMPPPGVFQLDSSPPPLRDPGDLGFSAFDVDLTKMNADGDQVDAGRMDDVFARTPIAPVPQPKSGPLSSTMIYVGIGLVLLIAAIVALVFRGG
ncbi:MAG: tetratricopeptide repeat protein [Candidatus Hydrogenedentes bacterium]|nr:tetratricopeptide repeat protein [Candidatus Hydrogenedentota bacterium]